MAGTAEIFLKPRRDKSVRRRHPWIFSGAIERVEGEVAAGAVVRVLSHEGDFLAHAAWSPASQIRLRVLSFDEDSVIDGDFIRGRIERAIDARRELGLLELAACRLVFGEADGLPGLVVDRYADYLVCQFLAAGIEPWRPAIVEALSDMLAPIGIFERSEAAARRKEGLASRRGVLAGIEPPSRLEIGIEGLKLLVDLEHGQKTGAYLDQRENRRRVAAYARGRRVLDAFAYTGAFGLACLAQGAIRATFVDSSGPALGLASEQAELNGLADRSEFHEADVGDELRRLRADGERFDLVVLDPPKFVQTAAQLRSGCRAYKDVNRLGLELLRPGGVLATFSCSGHVDAALFRKVVADAGVDAGRDAQILERLSQPPDHPVTLGFPEAEYLAGLVLRV